MHTMLMSKLTQNYLMRDRFFDELGFIPISKDFLKSILDRIDEKNIIEDGKMIGITKIGEYVVYFFHKIDSNTLIKFIELYLSTQDKFRKENNNGLITYTLHHNINKRYSLFLQGFLFNIIERIIQTKVNLIEITPNLLIFTFEMKQVGNLTG